jgi:hypothetical protein
MSVILRRSETIEYMPEITNTDAINEWSQAPIEAFAHFGKDKVF